MHYCTNVSVKSKHAHPPRANPQAFLTIFENMRQIPGGKCPAAGQKSVANPPPGDSWTVWLRRVRYPTT
jgi:hypothetical protein